MASAPPPPYSAIATPVVSSGYTRQPYNVAGQKLSPDTKPPGAIFPNRFGIYHAPVSRSDMRISLSKDSPSLFYVSTHGGFSSQPSVVLHCGPSENTSVMATADFHSFSGAVDVVVLNKQYTLEREGVFSTLTSFVYPIPQSDGQILAERFEWKSSYGPEVQSLLGGNHGMKCVRARTGEVVAAWATPHSLHSKKGKMGIFVNGGMGEERGKFELMIVISMLSIMEKSRRRKNSARAGAAAANAAH